MDSESVTGVPIPSTPATLSQQQQQPIARKKSATGDGMSTFISVMCKKLRVLKIIAYTIIGFFVLSALTTSIQLASKGKNKMTMLVMCSFIMAALASGAYGIWKEKLKFIYFYCSFMVLVTMAIAVITLFTVMDYSKCMPLAEEEYKYFIDDYNRLSDDDLTKLHDLHKEGVCCGFRNYTEWIKTQGFPDGNTLPSSCCPPDPNNKRRKCLIDAGQFFNFPCLRLSIHKKKQLMKIVLATNILLLSLSLVALSLTIIIILCYRKKRGSNLTQPAMATLHNPAPPSGIAESASEELDAPVKGKKQRKK
ncbi:hypothetical protein HELRODRAFT_163662 [Helobdella robusta]|uniref:Tetraspanin n=1 Tax=Helobdella robusta TaxID=6412 RepID=T1EUB9_HELRO|nr:hypothetical protein HELRODRAFT_163662 [Helobdella robusta]ESN96583.1 hypothetical protein HELRODRAFT_163662 [Helobdella robusta]